jgi:HEAT repeat protein
MRLTPAILLSLAACGGPRTFEPPASALRTVAERRQATALMLHRGSSDLAPENTLDAYELTFVTGGDGIEIDLRRTRDGTIVLLHDEWIDRVLDGFGNVPEMSYEVLLLYPFRDPAFPGTRVPALAQVLALCKRYHGLLHLDIKVPGIDAEILRQIDEAGLLDHVATVNAANSEVIRKDARVKPLPSQGSLIHGANDYAAAEIEAKLRAGKGGTLLVDDPRAAASTLQRPASDPDLLTHRVPFAPPVSLGRDKVEDLLNAADNAPEPPELSRRQALARLILFHRREAEKEIPARAPQMIPEVRADWVWAMGRLAATGWTAGDQSRATILESLAEASGLEYAAEAAGETKLEAAIPRLVEILEKLAAPAARLAPDEESQRRHVTRIRLRAAAAKALGKIGKPTPEAIQALRNAALNRSLHLQGAYQGLDGAEAVKSLAALDPAGSVPLLKQIALQADTRLAEITKREEIPIWLREKPTWWDFRIKTEAIRALGAIGSPESRAVLESFLEIPKAEAENAWRELHWDAARALTGGRWTLSVTKLKRLFEHPTPAVRRAAAVYLLAAWRDEYAGLRDQHVPWAKAWGAD